ncbi:MAG: glycoside hydrolase [candidate division KSB1 bacterium]|nr:glycoside hydrolase [candidate division KSB1 bacterium]MDZ7273585.1 glycoside hydrolase [candidate division KSB1 bacterium]MDZ7286824.1 glycoside hydrolase [candidate division KSB1 bacterium]MDZ7299819.1 glycoside hydrolase [candidate division KSB1 bacterium]MDZ7308456.1 glycoside hydrolase [candidate division KSB1 bacterium]
MAALVTGLLLLLWLMPAVAQNLARPAVRVNRSARNPNEVAIAINPLHPHNLVAVSHASGRHLGTRVTNYAYTSFDGGRTFFEQPLPNPEKRVQGDCSVRCDAGGNCYSVYISFTGFRRENVSGIFCIKSVDGGHSWLEPVAVYDLNTATPFQDKPYFAIDNTGSAWHGNIYIAWTEFTTYGSAAPEDSSFILFSRSIDGGRSFQAPQRVNELAGDARDDDNTVEGCVPAVGPDGEVYLAWAGPDGIYFDKSRDGGVTFGQDVVVSPMPGGWNFDVDGIYRCNGMPVTACDVSHGPYRGTIYLNWIDQRHGDPDVFLAWSRDGGASWSTPRRVNDDSVGNGREQFLTWLAVDPQDGAIYILFYDRRAAGSDATATHVYLAASFDGGETFRNYRLSPQPFTTKKSVFFGDYTGIAAQAGYILPIWTAFTTADSLELRTLPLRKDDLLPGR